MTLLALYFATFSSYFRQALLILLTELAVPDNRSNSQEFRQPWGLDTAIECYRLEPDELTRLVYGRGMRRKTLNFGGPGKQAIVLRAKPIHAISVKEASRAQESTVTLDGTATK